MSLINQMLQDLEKRQEQSAAADPLPAGVHSAGPAPVEDGPRQRWLLMALAMLAFGGGALYWMKYRPVAASMPVLPTLAATGQTPAPAANASVVALIAAGTLAEPPATDDHRKKTAARKTAESHAKRTPPKKSAAALAPRPDARPEARKMPADSESLERAEAAYREALAAFGQGRTAESQGLARKALDAVPGHIGARQLLIRQLIEQRANDQARSELQQGLHYQPGQILWATWLVRLELERRDIDAARLAVDQALPYAAGQADFQSLAGAVAQRQGKADEAAEFYRRALQLKPGDGRSWVGLGLALEADGHVPEAREAFRRALASDNLSPELSALAQRKSR
ncbi:MAG: tetratricopeptide repeat protein [Bacteroidota bacterium]